MSNFAEKFSGMSAAESKSTRTPNPALGKAAYLVSSVRMHDSRTGDSFRAEVDLTCLWPIEEGETCDKAKVPANRPGDKVSICFFSGDRFLVDLKDFCLKAIGKEPQDEMEIADALCPKSNPEYANMQDLDRLHHMWDKVLPGLVCAFDSKSGKPTDAGIFDGAVIVEVGTVQKRVNKKIDKTKPDEKSNWVHDSNGNPVQGIYDNSYINRRIGFQEAGETLDEAALMRFFGTTEAFMELLKEHG